MKILIDNGHGIQTKGKRSPDGQLLENQVIRTDCARDGDPDFDISLTTKASGPKDYWITPYRHWLFLPSEFKDKAPPILLIRSSGNLRLHIALVFIYLCTGNRTEI